MALEYGGQRVGAMMYNGVTIGEAMIDGQIVYRSVVRVTPTPPTFHDGEPWITLPTVEGVTYSVSGTPGYDASVTVTATAQPGYELVGTASWTHTYGPPPSPYPLTGTFEIVNGAAGQANEVFSHTVVEPGSFTGTVTRESGVVTLYIWSVNGGSQTSGAAVTRTFTGLSVGDTIKVEALHTAPLNLSGTWSIVKN